MVIVRCPPRSSRCARNWWNRRIHSTLVLRPQGGCHPRCDISGRQSVVPACSHRLCTVTARSSHCRRRDRGHPQVVGQAMFYRHSANEPVEEVCRWTCSVSHTSVQSVYDSIRTSVFWGQRSYSASRGPFCDSWASHFAGSISSLNIEVCCCLHYICLRHFVSLSLGCLLYSSLFHQTVATYLLMVDILWVTERADVNLYQRKTING